MAQGLKIKATKKDCRLIIKIKLPKDSEISDNYLSIVSRNFVRGFFKPQSVKKNIIEYYGIVGVSLYEYLKNPISKRDFYFILAQIIILIRKIQSANLPIYNLLMDYRNIYINEVTKEIQFIYIPTVKSVQPNTNMVELIQSVVYSAKPLEGKSGDCISNFAYFINGLKPFNIDEIEKYIEKQDRTIISTIKRSIIGTSGFITNKEREYYEHYQDEEETDQMSEEDEDLPTENLKDEEATGLLGDDGYDEATGLLQDEETGPVDDEATGLLTEDGSEDTGLLVGNQDNIHFPTLLRVINDEVILINKPVFRLGKEKSYVDYFVTNNVAVSRGHADIIRRRDRCFIKDLNSKNHTYVNNQEIPIQTEVEIFDGDRIKLGNEEFIFNI